MPERKSVELIEKLIAFDTVSRNSNLELMAFVQEYLDDLGVASQLIHDETGKKANLYATVGPDDKPGIMLSGHTDVVPVDGQPWDTDPFQVVATDDKLYGRGTCDMKGFIAIVLAKLPEFLERGLETPLHLAFSHDEEVGCIGVRSLVEKMQAMPVKPRMFVVGEPTGMQVVIGHKGKRSYIGRVHGLEAHSSLAPEGVNAIEYAAMLIAHIRRMSERVQAEGPFDELYDVRHTTLHTGTIEGGTALNIVPRDCRFEFEFRYVGNDDPEALHEEIVRYATDELVPAMQAVDPSTGIDIELANEAPGLDIAADDETVTFVKALAGRNDHAKVAFATEAGLFQTHVGIPGVICGPGHIAQAHKPNEFIELTQIEKCEAFMARLMDNVCRS